MEKRYSFLAAVVLCLGLLFGSRGAGAQVFDPNTPAVIVPDTTERREVVVSPEAKRNKAAADSAKRTEHMFRAFGYQGIRLTRPGKAALLATILPGAGQIYNRRWWKLPLVYGALGTVVGLEVFYQQRYREFSTAYNKVTQERVPLHDSSLGGQASLFNTAEGINSALVFYRGNRDIFYLYIGLAYGLQVVDALVDAHLKDFDVSDDLSLNWQPTLMRVPGQASLIPFTPGLQVALRVK